MDKFIKNGENILICPEGLEYSINKNGVYRLIYDDYMCQSYLKEETISNIPNKIFEDINDRAFINKVINTFNSTDRMTTGVLLSGLKGCGKTLMAKRIASESNVPVVIVDSSHPTRYIKKFFNLLKGEFCIILDEIEKNFHINSLLEFLDGMDNTCKKLVICTCNNTDNAMEFLIDRCSRIRYHKKFEGLSKDIIKNIFINMLDDKSKIDEITNFVYDRFVVKSFDNAITFAEEINANPTSSIEEIISVLNINLKDKIDNDSEYNNEDEKLSSDCTDGFTFNPTCISDLSLEEVDD